MKILFLKIMRTQNSNKIFKKNYQSNKEIALTHKNQEINKNNIYKILNMKINS